MNDTMQRCLFLIIITLLITPTTVRTDQHDYHPAFYATSSPSALIRNHLESGTTTPFRDKFNNDPWQPYDFWTPLRMELFDPDIYDNPDYRHGAGRGDQHVLPNAQCEIIRAGGSEDNLQPLGVYYWGGPKCKNPSSDDSPELTFLLCSNLDEHAGKHLHCERDLGLLLHCNEPFPNPCYKPHTPPTTRTTPQPRPEPQPEPSTPIGRLEVPGNGSYQSGIGFIAGWVCDGQKVEIVIDDALYLPPVARNIARGDTEEQCGDRNNGFILHWNWNLMGDGEHTAKLVVDDITLVENTFTVTTLGDEFIRDLSHEITIPNFPSPGEETTLSWQESIQNFVIVPGIDE